MAQQDILKKVEFKEEEEWSIKKITIGLALFIFLGVVGYTYLHNYLNNNQVSQDDLPSSRVRGAATENKILPLNYSVDSLQNAVEKNLDALKAEVNNLNAAEVATSSPQVQKILQDLKSLEQYPKNQVKSACMNVCNNL